MAAMIDGGGRGYFVIDWLFILATNMAAMIRKKRVFCYWLIVYFSNQHGDYGGRREWMEPYTQFTSRKSNTTHQPSQPTQVDQLAVLKILSSTSPSKTTLMISRSSQVNRIIISYAILFSKNLKIITFKMYIRTFCYWIWSFYTS